MSYACTYCGAKLKPHLEEINHSDNGASYLNSYYSYRCKNHSINVVFIRTLYTNYFRSVDLSDKDILINIELDKTFNNGRYHFYLKSNGHLIYKDCDLPKKINVSPANWEKLKSLLVFA